MSDPGEEIAAKFGHGRLQRDLFDFICGKRLGGGTARQVFEYLPCGDQYVIKIEDSAGSFQNILEWEMWGDFKSSDVGKRWLAPCWSISPCGIVLLQSRTQPLPKGYRVPKSMPVFLGDLKSSNYGLLKGKLVAHDYGLGYSRIAGNSDMKRMRRASWWTGVKKGRVAS